MEMKLCQSCGMPLSEEVLGTNADGSKNEEYCIYCYKDGAFVGGECTMEEMIEFCIEPTKKANPDMSEEDICKMYRQVLPTLKRWQ